MRGGLAKHVFDRSLLMALLFYELTTSSTEDAVLVMQENKRMHNSFLLSEYWITVFPIVSEYTKINRCSYVRIQMHCILNKGLPLLL